MMLLAQTRTQSAGEEDDDADTETDAAATLSADEQEREELVKGMRFAHLNEVSGEMEENAEFARDEEKEWPGPLHNQIIDDGADNMVPFHDADVLRGVRDDDEV